MRTGKRLIRAGVLAIATAATAGAILPTIGPALVIACGPAMLDSKACEKTGERIFLSTIGTMDSWAHEGRYGFSVSGAHIEPAESIALLKMESR